MERKVNDDKQIHNHRETETQKKGLALIKEHTKASKNKLICVTDLAKN